MGNLMRSAALLVSLMICIDKPILIPQLAYRTNTALRGGGPNAQRISIALQPHAGAACGADGNRL